MRCLVSSIDVPFSLSYSKIVDCRRVQIRIVVLHDHIRFSNDVLLDLFERIFIPYISILRREKD